VRLEMALLKERVPLLIEVICEAAKLQKLEKLVMEKSLFLISNKYIPSDAVNLL
jgi:hypothetical protein